MAQLFNTLLGMRQHSPSPSTGSAPSDNILGAVGSAFAFLAEAAQWFLSTLVGLGLTAAVIAWLYDQLFRKKRVDLALIGPAASGKSALRLRLVNPTVPAEEILKLTQSAAPPPPRRLSSYVHGKLTIYPRVMDVPGRMPSIIWDSLIYPTLIHRMWRFFPWSRKLVLLAVLAPTQDKSNDARDHNKDQRFVDDQLVYLEIIRGGLQARRTRKPALLIVFINKFDLYSDHEPEAAHQALAELQSTFAKHVLVVRSGNPVPTHLLYGSVLLNWNCKAITDYIGLTLAGIRS